MRLHRDRPRRPPGSQRRDQQRRLDAIDLALSAGGKLRHLLVDEMQDTSATQYDLIHQLTRSWDGATQTLFLVGDPKQSIYLFRQARVERFLRTMHEARFGDIRLQALRLTSNFRSQASLVHAFNSTFERICPPPDATQNNTSDVPFVAAVPSREPSSTDDITWHTAILGEEELDVPRTNNTRRDHDQQQARNIRSIIEHWLASPLPADRTKPWRIAVLARARKHLDANVAEFKRDYGSGPLRYRAVDIDPLSERPEIFDVLALTRALLHPADRPAWLAVLHAPWCGLSLADLLALTDEGPTADPCATVASLVATRTQFLSVEGQQLLARTWPVLQTAVATLGHAPFATQIERTWRSLGGDAPLTPEERTNVMRFLGVLREVQSDLGYLDLNTLTARLDRLYAEPISGPCSVELLTIHKAKGLEWDVVLVPSLERKGGSSSGDLLNWLEIDSPSADTAGVVLAPIASKGSDNDKLNRWLNAAREARENSERKRLFYVLSTRAREELHLFAACARKNDGTLATPQHGSLLKAVWPAAAEAFAPLQAPPATSLVGTFAAVILIDDHEPLRRRRSRAHSRTKPQSSTASHFPSTPMPALKLLPPTGFRILPPPRSATGPHSSVPKALTPSALSATSSTAICKSSAPGSSKIPMPQCSKKNSPPGSHASPRASAPKASPPPHLTALHSVRCTPYSKPLPTKPASGFFVPTPLRTANRLYALPRPTPANCVSIAPSSPAQPRSPKAHPISGLSTSRPPNKAHARLSCSSNRRRPNTPRNSRATPARNSLCKAPRHPSYGVFTTHSYRASSAGREPLL